MAAIRKRGWTAADVRALIDDRRHWPRYELLDGELLVTPAPTAAHQFAAGELFGMLREYCKREGIGIAATSPADIQLTPESIMQPDVFVIPTERIPANEPFQWADATSLLLAIEVLLPSTMRQDRVDRRDFYLTHGVEEYWVVDLDARVIERWTADQRTPGLHRDRIEWHPRGAAAPLGVDVRAFFAGNRALPRVG